MATRDLSRIPPPPASAAFGHLADEGLATLAGSGDERAFEAIYTRYRDPLYRYCRAILRHPEDAEEALQTAMLKAYRALSAGASAKALRPWLFAIAHNECVSLIRARPSAEPLAELPEPGIDRLEDRVEMRERLRQLRRDLLALPAPQREALVLRELSGLSHREISEVMGETPGVVKQLIYEARQSLLEFGAGRDLACGEVRRRLVDADGRVMRARRMTSHLRACEGCRAFVADEERRRRGLLILFPPLPVLAAGRILEGVLGREAGSGGASWWGSRGSSSSQTNGVAIGGLAAAGAVAASVAIAIGVVGGGGPAATTATPPAPAAVQAQSGSAQPASNAARPAGGRTATRATGAGPASAAGAAGLGIPTALGSGAATGGDPASGASGDPSGPATGGGSPPPAPTGGVDPTGGGGTPDPGAGSGAPPPATVGTGSTEPAPAAAEPPPTTTESQPAAAAAPGAGGQGTTTGATPPPVTGGGGGGSSPAGTRTDTTSTGAVRPVPEAPPADGTRTDTTTAPDVEPPPATTPDDPTLPPTRTDPPTGTDPPTRTDQPPSDGEPAPTQTAERGLTIEVIAVVRASLAP